MFGFCPCLTCFAVLLKSMLKSALNHPTLCSVESLEVYESWELGVTLICHQRKLKTLFAAADACSELSQSHQDKYLDLTDGHSSSLKEVY